MPIFWKKDYKKYNKLSDFYFGDIPIKKAYYGSTLVYDSNAHFGEVLFNTQGLHEFIVPRGHKFIDVEVCAGQGQNRNYGGGGGGLVTCRLKVTPKQKLYCYVGGQQNGGGTPQYNASDIRFKWDSVTGDTLNDRVVTAGGGGNGGVTGGGWWNGASAGGAGGYPAGSNSGGVNPKAGYAAWGAGGATQMSPGGGAGTAGGNYSNQPGYDGTFGLGGAGATAGGAGWYGGGGGAYCIHRDSEHDLWVMGSGGGGGSSYADNQYCSNVVYTGNYRVGNGYIKIKEVIS